MVRTFDFVIQAQHDNIIKNQLLNALFDKNDSILNMCNVELSFDAKEKIIKIDCAKGKELDYKVVPAIVKYSALEKMMNNNWNFSRDEIVFFESD